MRWFNNNEGQIFRFCGLRPCYLLVNQTMAAARFNRKGQDALYLSRDEKVPALLLGNM